MSVFEAFKAGFTRRWHTHERLGQTVDRVDGHSARVARIILMLHPCPSPELVWAALVHDDGEQSVGDLKGPAKSSLPAACRAAIEEMESISIRRIWGRVPNLTDRELMWLKFADRMDAIMWCAFHAPDFLAKDGWGASQDWCRRKAVILGVEDAFNEAVRLAHEAGGGV